MEPFENFFLGVAVVILVAAIGYSVISFGGFDLRETKLAETPAKNPERAEKKNPVLWGAYAGDTASDFISFENRLQKQADMQAVFVGWGSEDGAFPVNDAVTGKTLVIFWESQNGNATGTEQPEYSYDAITRGDWDAYIASFAKSAKEYNKPIILVPFHEMNGDWYPWSGTKNGNSAEKHVAAYRHVREFFRDAPNVKFGWAPNADSVPDTEENSLEKYYPGNDAVDYVGVDGFNFGDPWQTFSEIFNPALKKLSSFQKPIFIFSFACAEGPKKSEWISDALQVQIPKHKNIAGWIWFNENKEKNWAVWSDERAAAAFKNGIP